MPNAKTAQASDHRSILIEGEPGTGKTTQILTLPKPVFVYIFDPNALASLRGHDIEYEQFLPDLPTLSVRALGKTGAAAKGRAGGGVYDLWEKDFDEKRYSNFFEGKWLAFDSATTFLDLIMDRVLEKNGRVGQWPNRDDWGPQMNAFRNVLRAALQSGAKGIYLTAHLDTTKDEVTGRVTEHPLLTGRLKVNVPLLFSEFLATEIALDKEGRPQYGIRTVPTQRLRGVRSSTPGLRPVENVTLDWNQPLVGQGLCKVLGLK